MTLVTTSYKFVINLRLTDSFRGNMVWFVGAVKRKSSFESNSSIIVNFIGFDISLRSSGECPQRYITSCPMLQISLDKTQSFFIILDTISLEKWVYHSQLEYYDIILKVFHLYVGFIWNNLLNGRFTMYVCSMCR